MRSMYIKFLAIMAFGLPIFFIDVEPSLAENIFKWSVGVDVPMHYTAKFHAGEHGVLIKGVQENVGRGVIYEIVEKDFWSDKSYDKVKINKEGSFSAKLTAPPGNEYRIKISGNGNLASGELTCIPY